MEITKLNNLYHLLSEKISNEYVCQPVNMPSSNLETCAVEAKLDTVSADVDDLKELTSLLKLQNEVSDEDFHTYTLVVDQLEKKIQDIEKMFCRSPPLTLSTSSIIPPTPPLSLKKSRPRP